MITCTPAFHSGQLPGGPFNPALMDAPRLSVNHPSVVTIQHSRLQPACPPACSDHPQIFFLSYLIVDSLYKIHYETVIHLSGIAPKQECPGLLELFFFRFISIFLKDKFVQLTIEERQTFIIFKNVGVPYRETAKKVKNLNYVKKKIRK